MNKNMQRPSLAPDPSHDGGRPIAVEHRLHPRTPVHARAKVKRLDSSRYHAGTVQNSSAGGVLVALDDTVALQGGEAVAFVADWQGQRALLPAAHMIEAVVVRGFVHAGQTHVALRFRAVAHLAKSA